MLKCQTYGAPQHVMGGGHMPPVPLLAAPLVNWHYKNNLIGIIGGSQAWPPNLPSKEKSVSPMYCQLHIMLFPLRMAEMLCRL